MGDVYNLRQQSHAVDGGGGGGEMEARIAKLESDVDHIQDTLRDIKADTREIKRDAREDFRVLAGLIIVAVITLVGVMAKGFGWV